jgi:hypothetical protein
MPEVDDADVGRVGRERTVDLAFVGRRHDSGKPGTNGCLTQRRKRPGTVGHDQYSLHLRASGVALPERIA